MNAETAGEPAAGRLERLRSRIDDLDQQIAQLLQDRARISLLVGEAKAPREGSPARIFAPDREAVVIGQVQRVPGPLGADALASIYREVLSHSRALQQPLRVAHLGPSATFGHQAALERFGTAALLEPCRTHAEVFTLVEKGQADLGLVGIENSTEGPVIEVLDRLVDTPLQACDEVILPVSLTLVSHATRLEQVGRVLAHPQALGQSRGWLQAHLPHAAQEAVSSNGRGAQLASEDGSGTIAAIAPRIAASVYQLNILAENVQDVAGNYTRFLVLGWSPSEHATAHDKTAAVFSIRDRVGALRDLTGAFASHGVNMSSIQSRPSRRRAWDYLFFVELDGHVSEERVQRALHEAEEHTVFMKVLGAWPSAEPPRSDSPRN